MGLTPENYLCLFALGITALVKLSRLKGATFFDNF